MQLIISIRKITEINEIYQFGDSCRESLHPQIVSLFRYWNHVELDYEMIS